MRLLKDVVEIWRAPLTQGRASAHRDWSRATRVATVRGSLQALANPSSRVAREASPGTVRAYLAPGSDVAVADRLAVADVWFEVIEAPETWRLGCASHVRVAAKAVPAHA